MGRLNDALEVLRFELVEALRTRRIVVLAVLFLVAGALSAWGVARVVGSAESVIAQTGVIATGPKPGGSLSRVREWSEYRSLVGALADDAEAAKALADTPPLAVVFAWMMMTFLPLLALLTSADVIAQEIESGAVRYTLLRTGRLEYVMGKLGAHVALGAAVVGLSAATFVLVCALSLADFSIVETGGAILRWWPALVANALPWFALAFAASMIARAAPAARALALLLAVALSVVSAITHLPSLREGPVVPALMELVDHLTPAPRGYGLLAPVGATLGRAIALTLLTTVLYLGAAFARFRTRDL